MNEINRYLNSWNDFRNKCEEKVKGRCYINNKGWTKLRDFHMEQWLSSHKTPFGFMFKLKHRYWGIYRSIPCAPKWYHITRLQRELIFNSNIGRRIVIFPSWKGFLKNEEK